MSIYKTVATSLSEIVNKTQYFNPFFSWLIVSFTYFSIGIHGGTIWKYLFYAATMGFMAISCSFCYTISKNLDYYHYDFFVKLTWLEGYLWTLNECGYVLINYIKIQSCIKSLRKNYWKLIMTFVLIYSMVVRTRLIYLDYTKRVKLWKGEYVDELDFSKNKDIAHAFLYLPLGVVCSSFIFFIIKELIEENDHYARNVMSILLHSTLSRMLIVSLLFISLAVFVNFPYQGTMAFIRDLLWRIKGNLGLIFLIDILLLRIDFDHSQMNMIEQEMEKINEEHTFPKNNPYHPNHHYHPNGPTEDPEKLRKMSRILANDYSQEQPKMLEHHHLSNLKAKGEKSLGFMNPYKIRKGVPSEVYVNQHLNSERYRKSRDLRHSMMAAPNLPNNSLPYMISKPLNEGFDPGYGYDFEYNHDLGQELETINKYGRWGSITSKSNNKLNANRASRMSLPYISKSIVEDDEEELHPLPPSAKAQEIYLPSSSSYSAAFRQSYLPGKAGGETMDSPLHSPDLLHPTSTHPPRYSHSNSVSTLQSSQYSSPNSKTPLSPSLSMTTSKTIVEPSYGYTINSPGNSTTTHPNRPSPSNSSTLSVQHEIPFHPRRDMVKKHPGNIVMESELRQYEE